MALNKMNRTKLFALGGALVCLLGISLVAHAEEGKFHMVYQGHLEQTDQVDGTFEMKFMLYDDADPTTGTLLATLGIPDVVVSNGSFTVEVDFTDVPQGSALWLQFHAKPVAGGKRITSPHLQQLAVGQPPERTLDKNNLAAKRAVQLKFTADYDSGWLFATNSSSHMLYYAHGLGTIPSDIQVYFSPDLQNVYPLTWNTDGTLAGNPITIGANASVVSLSIYSGYSLRSIWDPYSGWMNYSTGYFRVLAWQ